MIRKKVKTIIECMLACNWKKPFPVKMKKGKFLRFGFGYQSKLVTIFLMPNRQHKIFCGTKEYVLREDEMQYLTDKLIKGKK